MLRQLNTCNVNILKLKYNSDCSTAQSWPKQNLHKRRKAMCNLQRTGGWRGGLGEIFQTLTFLDKESQPN